jgi:hypothetical protein
MNPTRNVQPMKTVAPEKRYSSFSVTIKSLLATGIFIGVIGASGYLAFGSGLLAGIKTGDVVAETQKAERQNAYAALSNLSLTLVPDANITSAVEGMGLPLDSKEALLARLKGLPSSPTSASQVTSASENVALVTAEPSPSTAQTSPQRLAWITLWDTDTEDGDVVRIDSQGYSRTITLTRQPVTFAIPVPRNGTLSVTGVRDGEGGGITVGLASGESHAVFPIMSVGQMLGLKVRVR